MGSRLNISVTDEEMRLLKAVAPPRQLSRFIKEAAVERARLVQREALRRQIVAAYEADPEFQREAGAQWDAVACEGWPEL